MLRQLQTKYMLAGAELAGTKGHMEIARLVSLERTHGLLFSYVPSFNPGHYLGRDRRLCSSGHE